jgi:hypothetical protein
VAGDLAELADWARSVALKYVDDVEPLRELASLGFWLPDVSKVGWDADKTVLENLDKTARSDEFGAFVLGVSGALLARYRRWQLYVPRPGAPIPPGSLMLGPPDDVVLGRPLVRRASGILVRRGSGADPYIGRLGSGPAWYQPDQRGLVTDPSFGRPPTWARLGGRALGAAGAGLSAYDSFMSQWEQDAQYHPERSTGQRVASAGYNAATEGGGAIYGGLMGAKFGAAAGSFIPIPVVGTLVHWSAAPLARSSAAKRASSSDGA